jgi:hypothetical protein
VRIEGKLFRTIALDTWKIFAPGHELYDALAHAVAEQDAK